jgi:hypothetical protein
MPRRFFVLHSPQLGIFLRQGPEIATLVYGICSPSYPHIRYLVIVAGCFVLSGKAWSVNLPLADMTDTYV